MLGNKLTNSDFMDTIQGVDILSLVETHSRDKTLEIPGFKRPFQLMRKSNHGKKCFGGIAVFVKTELATFVKEVNSGNKDVLWIKVQCDSDSTPIFIGTVYLSPASKYNKEVSANYIKNLETDVMKFEKLGKVILLGDLNARTGSLDDFTDLKNNKFCYEELSPSGISENDLIPAFSEDEFIPLTKRNSEDTKICKRGKELLLMCKNLDLSILNGRMVGDIFGKISCFKWNGCSVVDYAICSRDMVHALKSFKVLTLVPWLSDHAPIQLDIYVDLLDCNKSKIEEKLDQIPPSFFWDNTSSEKYKIQLNLPTYAPIFAKIEEMLSKNVNCEDVLKSLNSFLKQAVDAKIKLKKVKGKITTHKKWFDRECDEAKKELRDCTKKLTANPKVLATRLEVNTKRKYYMRLIRKKKGQYQAAMMDTLTNNAKQPKTFWKILKNLNNAKTAHDSVKFSESNILNYFKNLLQTDRTQTPLIKNSDQIGHMDGNVSIEEVNEAISLTKKGKATGLDGLNRELISIFHQKSPETLAKLYTQILNIGTFPREWSTSLMILIHKKGDKTELSNYRGILLLPTLSKNFCSILNKRILSWATNNNKFSEAQLGFMKGNRTSDALTILHNLIDKYCHKQNSKFYACFVDFQKAFDKVPRDLLLNKLYSLGLNGNIFNVIKSMYNEDKARVKMGEFMSKAIDINQGVRQGCVLSPTLFNLFLSDFETTLKDNEEGQPVFIDNVLRLPCILWANDIVIFSESRLGLQSQIDKLYDYSQDNLLPVNINKTKCICFNKHGRVCRSNLLFNGIILDDVNQYMYLGFVVKSNGNFHTALQNLAERASKAFYKIRSALGKEMYRNVDVAFKIFDTIIKPVALYASDVWGFCSSSVNEISPADIFHQKFCKWVLGVSKRTANIGVLYELGRYPISFDAQLRFLNNWIRIMGNKLCNDLVLTSVTCSFTDNLRSADHFLSTIRKTGFFFLHENVSLLTPKGKTSNAFKTYLINDFEIRCKRHISSENSKLSMLNTVKCHTGKASYLLGKNLSQRSTIAKFRLSDHVLEIEKGRFRRLPRSERVCPFCPSCIEDESHFLLTCPNYNILRSTLHRELNWFAPNRSNVKNTDYLTYLLNPNISNIGPITHFINQALLQRSAGLRNET